MEDILRWCLLFFVYAFIGWCCEVSFAAMKSGRFVNRGFLNGPVCPIYGFGMIAVCLLLQPISDMLIPLFFASMVVASVLELAVGFIAEKSFGMRLWDYSNEPFNFKGYVCLRFSVLWGLGCVFAVKLVQPALWGLVLLLPNILLIVLDALFAAVMLTDLVLTLIEALKLPKRLRSIDEAERALRVVAGSVGGSIADGTLKLKDAAHSEKVESEVALLRERLDKLTSERNYIHDRLISAFPATRDSKFGNAVKRVRESAIARHKKSGSSGHSKRRG